jgi:hypothetical protein
MAKPILEIQFSPSASPCLVHRALNFIEDVFREAEGQNIGSINDIDHYGSGIFFVQVSSIRHLGKMHSLISKLLKKHMLETEAVVIKSDVNTT